MAGIYFHIPFCKTRCIYCDFYSSTGLYNKDQYVDALCRELFLRSDYLVDQSIDTIYFGGGTPSLLNASDFNKIFKTLKQLFPVMNPSEITMEANPDDITPEYLNSLKEMYFNRISIGIQSFNDKELIFLKRRHDGKKAIEAVNICQKAGFENISIDLMYGLPGQTMESWKKNLEMAVNLKTRHISAYHLIYEENTVLYDFLKSGHILPVDEELSLDMFSLMIDYLTENGFEHYETSNFGQKGFHSQHNSSYWNGTLYMGVGVAAHSYNGLTRQWNKGTIDEYTSNIMNGQLFIELEIIDKKTGYNDFIITRLRTSKGIDLNELTSVFGKDMTDYCLDNSQKYLKNDTIELNNGILRLTRGGWCISDFIMRDLMIF